MWVSIININLWISLPSKPATFWYFQYFDFFDNHHKVYEYSDIC